MKILKHWEIYATLGLSILNYLVIGIIGFIAIWIVFFTAYFLTINYLKSYKWELSKINQGFQMTRLNGDKTSIECRELYWWEKIKYFKEISKIN